MALQVETRAVGAGDYSEKGRLVPLASVPSGVCGLRNSGQLGYLPRLSSARDDLVSPTAAGIADHHLLRCLARFRDRPLLGL